MTLVCRPRRFGKTLTLSVVRRFLSNLYDRNETEKLFEGLEVTGDVKMMEPMSRVPVVSLSLADVWDPMYAEAVANVKMMLSEVADDHAYLMNSDAVSANDKRFLAKVNDDMDDLTAKKCPRKLCRMLEKHWGVAPVVLLDEYDTPLVKAWEHGYWNEMVGFVGGLFNSTFKNNDYLGRALITGITRVAQESIFSDMNNLCVASVTSPFFEAAFGFTEVEVLSALEEYGLSWRVRGVRRWYDGYSFSTVSGIYNPWSIANYLACNRLETFWANTSSDALISRVVRAHPEVMTKFETLLAGGHVEESIDLRVNFHGLELVSRSVWPLLLAAGYLTYEPDELLEADLALGEDEGTDEVTLALTLTNLEVKKSFKNMVREWFDTTDEGTFDSLSRALLTGDVEGAQQRLEHVVTMCVSMFDIGTKASKRSQPERFFHGLTLGMLVDLIDKGYEVRSNLESGLGRLDVTIIPNDGTADACVLEFKVAGGKGSHALKIGCGEALKQIEDRHYDDAIISRGIDPERIHHFGIAFHGKRVLYVAAPDDSVAVETYAVPPGWPTRSLSSVVQCLAYTVKLRVRESNDKDPALL